MISSMVRVGIVVAALAPAAVGAEGVRVEVSGETIQGPPAGTDAAAWRQAMEAWRRDRRAAIGYQGAEYARPELAWAQRSFIQPQVMVEERYLYDPASGKYTVDRYLDDLQRRYGGIDSVLIWPNYPNIGVDNRNQHDLLHDMPGGLPGLRGMVDDFHRRGVRVLFPVNPWDIGTRREDVPLWEAAARDMKAIGADGINGDTMQGLGREFRKASDNAGHPLVLEPENQLADDAMVAWNNMSWGYWQYKPIPVVSKYKWIEPRHMVNVCERWATDRSDGLQSAFFNGVGYESWENVWGIWNELTPRDAELLRRIARIEREMADLLASPDWQPHFPTLQAAAGVYASRFPGKDRTLWLLVNRSDKDVVGPQLRVPGEPAAKVRDADLPEVLLPAPPVQFLDLWGGKLLTPEPGPTATLSFLMEKHGFGAILAIDNRQISPREWMRLMAIVRNMALQAARVPLAGLSAQWRPLPQKIVDIPPTAPAKEAPEGMVLVRGGKYRFTVSGVEIEGDGGPGVDFQYPWEDLPHPWADSPRYHHDKEMDIPSLYWAGYQSGGRRHHDKEMDIPAFYIDKYPVTNAQFKQFLAASGYRPKDEHNFLKDWREGTYPAGWDRKPVTWVALEDARAYAAWAGKRLPHEWEWQYAAQGVDGRLYPWGNRPDPAALPPREHGRTLRPPTDVDAFPRGASPAGVMDLAGNVWQWTDEYVDEHTRAAVLRGGGYYRPDGSGWYFPENTRLDQHAKYLLIGPSKDRSSMIGFRCVRDADAKLRASRWPAEKAWRWYAGVGPICGCNFLPRTAVNSTEMWQKETFDPGTIDEELGWAQRCGINSVRVFIQYIVYEADPRGLIQRMERFLEIADRHHISATVILLDDCFIPEPKPGRQPDPIPGVHNSQWTASPGNRRKAPEHWPELKRYVVDVVGHFGRDRRVLVWDLYNEAAPQSRPLVEAVFAWAREANPSQPLTSCWQATDLWDVASFHDYGSPNSSPLDRWIAERPALCTECIARGCGSRIETVLPAFAQRGIGWYMWGLVKGRIQTYYPWGSSKGAPEPKLWHHDLLQPDGTPHRAAEIEVIRQFAAKFRLPRQAEETKR